MAYDGELLTYCPRDLDFSVTTGVVVSGANWNPCGHMLLCCGNSSSTSWYFHVSGQGLDELYGVYAYPKFMREADYARYLRENSKREIRRMDARITNPTAAYQRLVAYMNDKWFWKVLPNNCATFAKEVVKAGGGDLEVLLNCPDQEVVRAIGAAISNALTRAGEFQRQNPGPKW
jgi:hypothetical protein